jgi:hypothetical protein
VELQKQDVRIFSNLKNIEEVQLVEVKKVAEEVRSHSVCARLLDDEEILAMKYYIRLHSRSK